MDDRSVDKRERPPATWLGEAISAQEWEIASLSVEKAINGDEELALLSALEQARGIWHRLCGADKENMNECALTELYQEAESLVLAIRADLDLAKERLTNAPQP